MLCNEIDIWHELCFQYRCLKSGEMSFPIRLFESRKGETDVNDAFEKRKGLYKGHSISDDK